MLSKSKEAVNGTTNAGTTARLRRSTAPSSDAASEINRVLVKFLLLARVIIFIGRSKNWKFIKSKSSTHCFLSVTNNKIAMSPLS